MTKLKLTLILICNLLFASSNLQAQAPEKINYQAVARNLAGAPLINQPISVKYEIRQGSPTGTLVFAETHSLTTSPFGLFSAEIGGGTPISGTFSGIAWGTSPFYLFVEVDGAAMGTTQLLSVPYALYAKESANGPAGLPGKNSLSLSTPYTGPACINGGTQVDAGLDDNNDGTLQPLEIDYTYIICNGTNGTNGSNGTNGIDGVSIDSTINNNNGTFSIYYSNGTSFTTSDLTGPAGANGTSGTTYFAGNGISLSGDTITNLGDLDNNPTNELQLLSVSNDTIFLSNGGFAPLPSAGGFWTQLGGSIHNNNVGNVGIGTNTPIHQLSVASNDSVVASFLGTDPNVAAILVGNVNASAATGIVFFNGVDTTSFIFLTPTTNSLTIRNNSINGNILISTDSIIVNQGLILVNEALYSIYNAADTIYSYSPSGMIVNVNQGMFLTDSLYVLGNNAANTNWILANDGFGQAKWTDPSTIVGSVGDNWGTQTVVTDTSLFGDGAGTPLSVNPNIIPTQTSQLTNNSGFITSPNDADFDPTNEIQNLSIIGNNLNISGGGTGTSISSTAPALNQVLTWDGSAWVAQNAGSGADNWGTQTVVTDGTLTGTGIAGDTLRGFDGQYSSLTGTPTNISAFANDVPYLTTFTEVDADTTNELQALSFVDPILTLSKGGGSVNLSTLSGTTYTAGTGINLTGDTITNTAPDQTVVITGAGTTSITSSYPSFIITTTDNDTSATNEIQSLSSTTSPGTVTVDITGGTSTTFSIDDADANPANELITSFAVNGANLEIIEAGTTWNVPLTSLSGIGKWTENAGNLYPTTLTNNVGIGTNTPSTKLHIVDSVSLRPEILLETSAGNFKIGYRYKTALAEWSMGQGEATGQQFRVSDIQSGTVPFVIEQGSGNVGIGTNTPGAKLHVNNGQILNNWTNPNSVDPNLMINNWNSASGPGYLTGTLGQVTLTTSDGAEAKFAIQGSAGGDGGSKYGIYGFAMGLGNANYAIYGDATGATTNWAGYFERGNVYVQNTLVLPTGAVNDYILKTDAAGNTSWADPATLVTSGLPSWSLTGNAGTNATTDFIGTTDNVALNFRVNNTTAGKIDSAAANSFFGFLAGASTTGNNNTAIGYQAFLSNTSGTYNTAIGANALKLNNIGNQNTAIGAASLQNNTGNNNTATGYATLQNNTGSWNTATGHSALLSNTTGNSNTANGFEALQNNTTGNQNTAVGQTSLYSNTTGNYNTALGHYALANNTTAGMNTAIGKSALYTQAYSNGGTPWESDNVAIGYEALYTNNPTSTINGNSNTAVGNFALRNNTVGNNNTANGYNSLYTNTTGSSNTANGMYTLYANTSGDNNTAIGYQSLWSNTTGTANTAVGLNALRMNTIGTQNTAIGVAALGFSTGSYNTATGYSALQNNTGTYNTANGHGALNSNTTGNNNTATGMAALFFNTIGSDNTANGRYALSSNIDGNFNVATGNNALYSNTSGGRNTAIGQYALYLNSTGNFNTALGDNALTNTTGGNNTGIGQFSGSNNTTGSSNTFLGKSADATVNNLTNATAVGANAVVSQSNSLILGNAANVGIGTSAPTAKLDVNGTIVISGANTNELNRAQTGTANLVPIAYGSVSSGATIANAGTGNWTVTAGGAGQYTITVTGETFVGSSHIMSGTMNGTYGFISLIAFTNNILVQTTNTGGANQNAAFSFVVYKP